MTTTTLTRLSTAPAYAVLPAEDLSRARSFYHDTLGFEITDTVGSGQFLVHAGSDSRFLVYERARTRAEHTVLAFIVDDLKSVVSDLRSRGIVFEEYDMPGLRTVDGIADMGDGSGAWFIDPEGNIINIAQMK